MIHDTNVGTISDYAERLKERALSTDEREQLHCNIWRELLSADRHISRFDMAARRYERAASVHDARAMFVERENMLASLYETIDTVFLVIRMIDPDVLDLQSSLDGVGITGDDAGFVHEVLERLEKICEEVIKREDAYKLSLDFSVPVDEREGVTYTHHPHWRDFVEGSIERSFFLYFEQVQKELSKHISKVPKFWRQRKLQQFFTKRPAITKFLRVILGATLGEASIAKKPQFGLTKRIEKHATNFVKRHWPLAGAGKDLSKEDQDTALEQD